MWLRFSSFIHSRAMAGTDRRRLAARGGPTIILVAPQLGENIGTAARAMFNCGLTELRLVTPRDGWPNKKATAAASGADLVLEKARVFDSVEDAIADLRHVYATTARDRFMVKRILTPRRGAAEMRQFMGAGERWSTVGVSTNVIDASYNALHDSLTYKLWRAGRRG